MDRIGNINIIQVVDVAGNGNMVRIGKYYWKWKIFPESEILPETEILSESEILSELENNSGNGNIKYLFETEINSGIGNIKYCSYRK